jgi:hypothetical protein
MYMLRTVPSVAERFAPAIPALFCCIALILALEAREARASGIRAIQFTTETPVQNESFNSTLASALRSGANRVDIAVTPSAEDHIPSNLKAWLDRIGESGGEIRWRDDSPPSRNFIGVVVGTILGYLGEKVAEAIAEAFADPAKNFNAVIVVNCTYDRSGRKHTNVTGIEFYRRGTGDWFEAVMKSKAAQ